MSLVAAKKGLTALLTGSSRGAARTGTPASAATSSPERTPLLGSNSFEHDTRFSTSNDDDDVESQTSTLGSGCSSSSSSRRISARLVSDATIGMSDGLTVPFALTAGLSALSDTRIVIYGGMAELIAGAISMGLGGYLGAKSEAASYDETLAQTNELIATDPQGTALAVRSVFEPYDLPKERLDGLTGHITASPDLAGFLMKFQHCEPEQSSSRAVLSGLTIAMGYFLGGLLPLLPYLCVGRDDLATGFAVSVAVMAVALFSFGYAKTCAVSGWRGSGAVRGGLVGGIQMVVVGGAAAASAMLLVKLFNSLAEDGGGTGSSIADSAVLVS